MSQVKQTIKQIALSEVHENPVALRKVNREAPEYMGLVESIREKGFISSITVRERFTEGGDRFYELIDGLHRFNAAKDVGIETVNAVIVSMDDGAVLEAQLMANVHKIETKPVEYTKQILRILSMNQTMTEAELAKRLGKSFEWIQQRLSLLNIENEQVKTLINEGKICLSNAYALAKLPVDQQASLIDAAITEEPKTFGAKCAQISKDIRDAKRKGEAFKQEWKPVQYLRKPSEIFPACTDNQFAVEMCVRNNVTSVTDAFQLALNWVSHSDPESIKIQRDEEDARVKAKEEAKLKREEESAKRKEERAKKMAEEAAKLADEATAALNR